MTSRDISANLKRQLFTPWRDKDIRALLTVDHAQFDTPFRFVSGDPTEFADIVSNGNTFITFPFDVTLLTDDESEPRATVRIQNVDDRIGTALLDLPDDAVTITLQIVMRETPNVIEYEAVNLELVDVVVDAMMVTGTIVIRGQAIEPCPGRVLSTRISPVFFR
jgi:hypothetical protein